MKRLEKIFEDITIPSRKLNCTCIFIGHRYFKNIDRTLKNNIDYLIFTQ